MSAASVPAGQGTRLHEHLCVVRGLVTRWAQLVALAFTRPADGATSIPRRW
ncbi:hypothetical protein [Streptomyces olivaceoviridis]|uniref:hypothetical protein n=1 Tax=Streptomyces olivaceoviridis TaxID=1921 RepID=UPI00167207BF|nr:hypothetical protein [Streptomyces olivaceoviridis]